MIAAYLLEPRRRGYPLDELAADAGIGVGGRRASRAAVRDAALVRELAARQRGGPASARASSRSTATSSCR